MSVVEPVTVRVVPAAIEVVARKSTALRVWLPVMVPPAKTSVEVPAFSIAGGVGPVAGGADGAGQGERSGRLVDDHQRQVAAGGGRRAGERLGAGAGDGEGGGAAAIAQGLADVALGGERAGAVEAPAVSVVEPVTVRVVPAAIEVVARKSTALRVWQPVIVPPAKTSVEVPAVDAPAV